MKRIYVLCEGETEESVVKNVLNPYFNLKDIYLIPVIIETKRTINLKYKGGISSFAKIIKELKKLCYEHPNEKVTLFIDFYGLPTDTPSCNPSILDVYSRVAFIEKEICDHVSCNNLIPYLNVHEFEALLFSDTNEFKVIADENSILELENIKNSYGNPEFINNSPNTAPSKRIISLIPTYKKIIDGTRILNEIGVEKVRNNCLHFNKWVHDLENL